MPLWNNSVITDKDKMHNTKVLKPGGMLVLKHVVMARNRYGMGVSHRIARNTEALVKASRIGTWIYTK